MAGLVDLWVLTKARRYCMLASSADKDITADDAVIPENVQWATLLHWKRTKKGAEGFFTRFHFIPYRLLQEFDSLIGLSSLYWMLQTWDSSNRLSSGLPFSNIVCGMFPRWTREIYCISRHLLCWWQYGRCLQIWTKDLHLAAIALTLSFMNVSPRSTFL